MPATRLGRRRRRLTRFMSRSDVGGRGAQRPGDGFDVALPDGALVAEVRAAVAGELVIAGAPSGVRLTPFARHPAALGESVQGGVERSFFDEEQLVGGAFDPLGDAVAVSGSPGEGFED